MGTSSRAKGRALRIASLCACVAATASFGCSGDPAASGAPRAGDSHARAGTGAASGGDPGAPAATDGTAGSNGASGAAAGAAAPAGAGSSVSDHGADAGVLRSGLPPPDPNVTFEWTATLPGGGTCEPGKYTGTFTCNYVLPGGDPNFPIVVTGPIVMTLERSQDGEFLEIADGKLEGIAMLVIGFRAQLTGRLDCATGKLEAMATDGIYGFGDPSVFPAGMFMGTLGGTLDPSTAELMGDWDLGIPMGGACVGPWQASWTP